jgi:hypothetical protein
MCGICGEIVLDPGDRVSLNGLTAMRSAIVHRGPDGAGLFVSPDSRVGLGFQRLRVIDLSPVADQPLVTPATIWKNPRIGCADQAWQSDRVGSGFSAKLLVPKGICSIIV